MRIYPEGVLPRPEPKADIFTKVDQFMERRSMRVVLALVFLSAIAFGFYYTVAHKPMPMNDESVKERIKNF